MGRLIDADELNEQFNEIITFIEKDNTKENISKEEFCKCLKILRECVDEQKTSYDVEKVLKQLEEASIGAFDIQTISFRRAVDIVRKGGVDEHN